MSNNTWVVIPAAGESKRFKDAGYNLPKPLLDISNRDGIVLKMIDHVISSIPEEIQDHYIIPALPSSHKEYVTPMYDVTWFIKQTSGQADTIYQVLKDLPPNNSVLILDCDVVLQTEDLSKLLEMLRVYDMVMAVAETFDPNCSRVDLIPFPTRFVEKESISSYGIIGARGFKNIGILVEALKSTLNSCGKFGEEPYLSETMNNYPGTAFALEITEWVDLGTPERVRAAGWEIV